MLLVDTRLVFFSDAGHDLGDGLAVLLHFLVVAATLTGVTGNDHVRHHFIDSGVSNSFLVLEQLLKELQEHSVFKALLFVPVPITVVLRKLPERGLGNSKREYFWHSVISEDLELIILAFFVCHLSNTINNYTVRTSRGFFNTTEA